MDGVSLATVDTATQERVNAIVIAIGCSHRVMLIIILQSQPRQPESRAQLEQRYHRARASRKLYCSCERLRLTVTVVRPRCET